METIKVNMTPCEDIKTIHASQNDNEGREWGFELHNNGEKIDSSSISDQMVFKAYKGGTEEILPTNGSTPTTSPFKGDIKYPQGLLTDQEFLYRESPTEEDGLAKITDIKGNTLVWNQLVGTNVNGLNTTQGTTFSLNSNGSIHVTGTGTGNHFCEWRTNENPSFVMVKGHKYLATFKGLTNGIIAQVGVYTTATTYLINKTNLVGSYAEIVTPTQDGITGSLVRFYATNTFSGTTDITMQLFDLTQMGLDISSPSDFTSLFPLSYYAYNQGTLLSFNGNGIKTVGKNLLNLNIADGTYLGLTVKKEDDGSVSINGRTTSSGSIYLMDNTGNDFYVPNDAVLSTNVVSHGEYDVKLTTLENTSAVTIGNESLSVNVPKGWYKGLRLYFANGRDYNLNLKLMIAFNSTEFEPYTSSTLSLPISTYFPNGMDGINDARDEKNETGYRKVISVVDLGAMSWTAVTANNITRMRSYDIKTLIKYPSANNVKANMICSKYSTLTANNTYDGQIGISCQNNGDIYVYDSAYSTADEFKQAMQGVILKYELSTPLENYGVVDLGTLNWTYSTTNMRFTASGSALGAKPSANTSVANVLCTKYATDTSSHTASSSYDKIIGISDTSNINIRDTSFNDATTFKQSLQGVYLLYEKQNPQGFTTATLVTENGEVALANENGVLVGKCNSDVSADAGFIEGKIKLSDEDGDIYSNKIQIHVERSPQ